MRFQSSVMDWQSLRGQQPPSHVERASVLIVEDEPTVRDVWQRSLSALGYETIAVEDAQQALPLLSSAPFVAICDVHLPGASGLWLIEQIRTASPHTAIILATADFSISALQSLRADIIAYLVKPFRLDELKAAVEAGVRWSALRRST